MTATADEIPEQITRLYPHIAAEAWERVSEHRYRAAHSTPNTAVLVVEAFGETIGRGVNYGLINFAPSRADRAVFAELIERAARLAAHRVACQEGTPIVRSDNDDHGVQGCCWWCGALPEQHVQAGASKAGA